MKTIKQIFKVIGVLILMYPCMLLSQEIQEIKWIYEKKSPKYTCTDFEAYRITFYTDNKFEFKGYGYFEGVVGQGKYEIQDSIISCVYNGKSTCEPHRENDIFEVVKNTNGIREIFVVDGDNQVLIGCEVYLKNSNKEIIDSLIVGFDGKLVIPDVRFNQIEIMYGQLTSFETKIFGELVDDLRIVLFNKCATYNVINGSKQEFKILNEKHKQIDLIQIHRDENSFVFN